MLRRVAMRAQFPECQPKHLRRASFRSLTTMQSPQSSAVPLLRSVSKYRCDHVPLAASLSLVQKRCFAAEKPPEGQGDEVDAEKAKNESAVLRKFYGAGTVVSGGVIAYGSWWCINSSMKMVGAVYAAPHLVAYAGFWFGFGTASMCAVLATAVYRLTFIRPEGAFKDTLAVVKNNPAVKAALGNHIRDGKLKTYEIKDGRFSVSGAMPTWLPHKLQMMYIIYGDKGMGLVTTVCVKKPSLMPRALDPNLLAVDFLDKDKINKDQETLVIVGDETQLEVRDNIHRLLDLKLDFALGNQK